MTKTVKDDGRVHTETDKEHVIFPVLLFEGRSEDGLFTYQDFFETEHEITGSLKPWYADIEYYLIDSVGQILELQAVGSAPNGALSVRRTEDTSADYLALLLRTNLWHLEQAGVYQIPDYDKGSTDSMLAALTQARGIFLPAFKAIWYFVFGGQLVRTKDTMNPGSIAFSQGMWRIRPWMSHQLDRSFLDRF